MNLADLAAAGFDVATENHARAVLTEDFPDALSELCEILSRFAITDVELVRGGGGEASLTRRLRRALAVREWRKHRFEIRKIVDGKEATSTTHEIDHICTTEHGRIALEIEWNNKDPFFDRDLENFQRLHAEGVISVGTIVTRGSSLQRRMRQIVLACVRRQRVADFGDLERIGVRLTVRQHRMLVDRQHRGGTEFDFVEAFAQLFVSDKFGQATTHWDKLQERIARGVGSPCPLLLVGIPDAVVRQAP